MKMKTVLTAIISISLSSGGFSFAKGGHSDPNGCGSYEQVGEQQEQGYTADRHDNAGRVYNHERYDRSAGPNYDSRSQLQRQAAIEPSKKINMQRSEMLRTERNKTNELM